MWLIVTDVDGVISSENRSPTITEHLNSIPHSGLVILEYENNDLVNFGSGVSVLILGVL